MFSKTSPLTTSAQLIPMLERPPGLLFLPRTSEKAASSRRGRHSWSQSSGLHRAPQSVRRAAGAEREKAGRQHETHLRSATSVLQCQHAVQDTWNVPHLPDHLPRNGGTMEDTEGKKPKCLSQQASLCPQRSRKHMAGTKSVCPLLLARGRRKTRGRVWQGFKVFQSPYTLNLIVPYPRINTHARPQQWLTGKC